MGAGALSARITRSAREEALESAKNVVLLHGEHVAAWAMLAEIHASSGRLADAADAPASRRRKDCPPADRKVARNGAVDIFDLRLKQPERALEQLDALVAEGDADDKAIERGVEIASKAELWDAALRFAKRAAERAQTPFAKSRAHLRVAEIHRDRLADPEASLKAAQQAHEAMPSRLEALRVVHALADSRREGSAVHVGISVESQRSSMQVEGPSQEHALAVEEAAQLAGDAVLTRAAQRVARVLGATDVEVHAVGVPVGKPSLRDPGLALRYRDPDDAGAAVVVLETVLPDMIEHTGLSMDAFGTGRAERIKGAHPIRDAVMPYVSTAGYLDVELYVGGNDERRIAAIPGDPVIVVLGKKLPPPFDDATRYRLMRALLLTARGLAVLQATPIPDAADIALAALAAAELTITGGTSRFETRLRPVAKALTRIARKAIAESGRQLAGSPDPQGELVRGARGALSTVRRGSLAVTGRCRPRSKASHGRPVGRDEARSNLVRTLGRAHRHRTGHGSRPGVGRVWCLHGAAGGVHESLGDLGVVCVRDGEHIGRLWPSRSEQPARGGDEHEHIGERVRAGRPRRGSAAGAGAAGDARHRRWPSCVWADHRRGRARGDVRRSERATDRTGGGVHGHDELRELRAADGHRHRGHRGGRRRGGDGRDTARDERAVIARRSC